MDVCSVPEGGDIVKLLEDVNATFTKDWHDKILNKCQDPNDKLYAWNLDHKDLKGLSECRVNWEAFEKVLKAYKEKFKQNAKFIVFKHPKINTIISNLSTKFIVDKGIYIITLIRDGRAIYASSKSNRQSGISIPMEVNPFISSRGWRFFLNDAEKNKQRLESNVYSIIKYEDLVLNYEEIMKDLMNSIGIREQVSTSILSQNIHEHQKHLHPNVNKSPDVKRINNWKETLSAREIRAFQYKSIDLLKRNDYEIQQGNYSRLLRSFDWLYYIFKSIWYKLRSYV
jgi:hypothetical protein